MEHIKNVSALRQALNQGQSNFRVHLRGGIFSRKTITLCAADGRFNIVNHIDESVQQLTGRQLYSRSIIGDAMRMRAFTVE